MNLNALLNKVGYLELLKYVDALPKDYEHVFIVYATASTLAVDQKMACRKGETGNDYGDADTLYHGVVCVLSAGLTCG
nr:hypothetical protein BaRGS_016642 [Batillaria attramentaria]